jgi:hypothetical protein
MDIMRVILEVYHLVTILIRENNMFMSFTCCDGTGLAYPNKIRLNLREAHSICEMTTWSNNNRPEVIPNSIIIDFGGGMQYLVKGDYAELSRTLESLNDMYER